MKLPTGVWYDAPNRRYRVRLYRNHRMYLAGYYPTLDEALGAHAELKRRLESIPRLKRGERPAIVPVTARFASLARAVQQAA